MLSIFWFWGSSGEFGDLPVNMVPEELSGGFGFGTGRLICFFSFAYYIYIELVFVFVLVLAGEFSTGRAARWFWF